MSLRVRSLPGHGDAQALLWGAQVIVVLGRLGDVDLHPLDGAVEDTFFGRVLVADRRGGVAPEIGRLVAGEDQRHAGRDRPRPDLLPIEIEADVRSLAQAAAR